MSCDSCVHSSRCKWLIGSRYGYEDDCDWTPSRYVSSGLTTGSTVTAAPVDLDANNVDSGAGAGDG